MAEIKLFRYGNEVYELKGTNATIEREIQKVIEDNMFDFFGVNFIRSEWSVDNGKRRIDSIGIDENNCPVIFEYKCYQNENVINQGLYYLNWLLEHRADYKLLVLEKYGKKVADEIDWSMPRVICIAGDFNKYDEEAIKQINRNIALIRYTKFENNLLMFELLNSNVVEPISDNTKKKGIDDTRYFKEQYEKAPEKYIKLFEDVKMFALTLGDDVSVSELQYYLALKKIKNFASLEIYQSKVLLNLKLNPDDFVLNDNLRDIRNVGHWGAGSLQLIITKQEQVELAKELLIKAYNCN